MSNYSALTATIAQQSQAREDELLVDETCRSRFFLQPSLSPKVFLFFHGFTATPEQFVPIGRSFFEAGYNVLIPLMPGHGLPGNWNHNSPPPLPEDQQTYQRFGQSWLEQVQTLGEEVIIGGLSSGATLAAWLAIESPQQVDRSLLFACYLSNSNVVVDLSVQILDIYFEWRTEPGLAHFGYDGFLMPALRVFLDMGRDVLERSRHRPAAPMLILSSESDRAVSSKDHQALFKSVSQYQPKSWHHCFDKVFDMPHTMMTAAEGNECIDLLIAVAKAYVESDLTWTEVEEISDRVAQGKSFDAVVSELDLGDRVSPDLVTLVTINH